VSGRCRISRPQQIDALLLLARPASALALSLPLRYCPDALPFVRAQLCSKLHKSVCACLNLFFHFELDRERQI